jgi:hypothetical protein
VVSQSSGALLAEVGCPTGERIRPSTLNSALSARIRRLADDLFFCLGRNKKRTGCDLPYLSVGMMETRVLDY